MSHDEVKSLSDEALLVRVLHGDEPAKEELVRRVDDYVRPVMRLELRRWPSAKLDAQDVDDLCNEVYAMLFADEMRALAKWDVSRSSLGTIASIYARSRFREWARKHLRRRGLEGVPVPPDEEPEAGDDAHRPDVLVQARSLANAIVACVLAAFPTPLAKDMIELLLVRDLDTDEVVRITKKPRPQIFRWRSRLKAKARECWHKVQGEASLP